MNWKNDFMLINIISKVETFWQSRNNLALTFSKSYSNSNLRINPSLSAWPFIITVSPSYRKVLCSPFSNLRGSFPFLWISNRHPQFYHYKFKYYFSIRTRNCSWSKHITCFHITSCDRMVGKLLCRTPIQIFEVRICDFM